MKRADSHSGPSTPVHSDELKPEFRAQSKTDLEIMQAKRKTKILLAEYLSTREIKVC